VLGTSVGLALGPALDHLSCCPLTNFIQEEAQQHMAWSLKEPNSASHQYLHFFHINQGQANQACPPRQAVMASNMHVLQKSTQALVQPGRIARTESQQLALDGKGSPVSGLPSKLRQNFTLMTDCRKSTGSLHLASPIRFPLSITTGAHIEIHTGFQ
jgi:hypothetical protein